MWTLPNHKGDFMKKVLYPCCLILLVHLIAFVMSSAFASTKIPLSEAQKTTILRSLATDYYSQKEMIQLKSLQTLVRPSAVHCDPHAQPLSCVTAACNHLSSYECDDKSDLEAIAKVCVNVDGQCIGKRLSEARIL